MTLSTRVRIIEPTAVREVFDYARGLLGAQEATWEDKEWYDGDRAILNEPGQGFAAWLIVRYGGGGLLHQEECDCAEWVEDGQCHCPPVGSVELDFDTAYGYQAENGAGCADLHAWLVREMGEWLSARGLDWWWYDELQGEWHHGITPALERFGDAERGRLAHTVGAGHG